MWLTTTRFIFVFVILLLIICDASSLSEKSSYLSSEIADEYGQPTSTTKYNKVNKNLLNPIEISDENTAAFPVKEKRCSNLKDPNPESTSDLRKLIEQRLEVLCKFCNTSELRMKTPMCKRCVPTNELLGNTKQQTSINKTEELPVNQPNKPEISENPTEFQYKSNNRDEKKMNYDTPVHINKTKEKLNKIDITKGLNSLKTNSTLTESAYKLLYPRFLHNPPQTITKNSPQSNEMKIWKLKENNTENAGVLWNADEKINNLDERTVLSKNPIKWNSNNGMNNQEFENGDYEQFSLTPPISKTSNIKSPINSQKTIPDLELSKRNDFIDLGTISSETFINNERKDLTDKGLHFIELENTNDTNKYTQEETPLIIPENIKSLLKDSHPGILNTLQEMLNTATNTEEAKDGLTDNENAVPKYLYKNGNYEIDHNLKSPSEIAEIMDSEETTTQNVLLTINDDPYKNAIINKIHDLFSQYLNMKPEIDSEKYKHFQIPLSSLKENESEHEEKLMNQQIVKTETKSKNSNNESNSIVDNNENVKNAPDIELNLGDTIQNNNKSQLEEESIEDVYEKNDDSGNQLHFIEEKIKLPLILRQNDDGTIQLLIDKSEMSNSCNEIADCNKNSEKNMCKRKTDNEDNLLKRSFNVINELNQDTNIPVQQIEDQETMKSDIDLKEHFYKHLINKQLKELFNSLNIEIGNSAELHTYIDDLPIDQKDQLKQYLLSSITELYNNDLNKNILQKEHEKYMQDNHNTHIIRDKKQKEENRVYFPMQSEESNISLKNINYLNSDKLISLIRNIVHSELQNSNLCPICSQRKCLCTNQNNNLLNPFSFSPENEDRVIDKRHNNYNDYDSNESDDISPHGIVKRRYKIFNNILNWARDIIIHNNTKKIND